MGLLPSEATFAEEVSDFFLAFRGQGVALSPLDADLLLAWQARGAPAEVVCRGIRRAAEAHARDARPDEPALRSLRACKRHVEEELKRFAGVATGRSNPRAPESVAHDRVAKARTTLRALAKSEGPTARAATRALRILEGVADDPAVAAHAVRRADEALALLYLRALAGPARRAILLDVRAHLGPALRSMTPRARKAALRAHRVIAARAHGSLPALK